ncbi:uncharacterized protein LOC121379135 [Gigantopelta aegis]|uniref:uncharacterized protein LOC121379135 n=1 Tax=Gigantopelta aegis TaxID=1735272 RepID=UPI001B88DE20|nr:uncharacterized protein LOC121379135 [Gigantopelta aegis]
MVVLAGKDELFCSVFIGFVPLLLTLFARAVSGHGRLVDPPSRSSMWRYGFKTPPNYDDNQLYCGGVSIQYAQNGGKCGVCGDPWQGPHENEPGGKYANGIIVKKYKPGQIMEAGVQLTANHKGYFEFRLCQNDIPFQKITHNCLDEHVLRLAGTEEVRFKVPGNVGGDRVIRVKLQLPKDVKCSACVFQWKYNAGNSWGTNPDGTSCIGCGKQEQFYGCADIAIGHDEVHVGSVPPKHPWYSEPRDPNWHWGIVSSNNDDDDPFDSGATPFCGGRVGTTLLLVTVLELLLS